MVMHQSRQHIQMHFRDIKWLTRWGRVTHICVRKLTIIGSDNGLSPGRRKAIIRTNAAKLLTHWDRVTHICVIKLPIIGSDNGLWPGRHQAIIWTNAAISLIAPLGSKLSEILIEIHTFSFKKMHLKSRKGRLRNGSDFVSVSMCRARCNSSKHAWIMRYDNHIRSHCRNRDEKKMTH